MAFHPVLKSFKTLYDQHQLAVIQGVGYPNASRSHFRSMEIWHTCSTDFPCANSGLSSVRLASEVYKVGDSPFQCGVNLGASVPQALLDRACTDRGPCKIPLLSSSWSIDVCRR